MSSEGFNHLLGIFSRATFRKNPKALAMVDFGTTNRSPAKHSAQASVSWCYWALRVEYPVYQEGVIDSAHGFSALVKWAGRISKKQSNYALHNCDWNMLDWSKIPKSQNMSQKMGGPPIAIQPVAHSILTVDKKNSWHAKRILVSSDPYCCKR